MKRGWSISKKQRAAEQEPRFVATRRPSDLSTSVHVQQIHSGIDGLRVVPAAATTAADGGRDLAQSSRNKISYPASSGPDRRGCPTNPSCTAYSVAPARSAWYERTSSSRR